MFGRASSRPIQKLEADPGIAIVPYEALSKGTPRNEEKSLTQLVGGNAQLVGRKAIAFSCSELWEFPSRCGVTGVLWSPAKGGRFAQRGPSGGLPGREESLTMFFRGFLSKNPKKSTISMSYGGGCSQGRTGLPGANIRVIFEGHFSSIALVR